MERLLGSLLVGALLLLFLAIAIGWVVPRFGALAVPGGGVSDRIEIILGVVALALAVLEIAETFPATGTVDIVGLVMLLIVGVVFLRWVPGATKILSIGAIIVSLMAIEVSHGASALLGVMLLVVMLLWLLGALRPLR